MSSFSIRSVISALLKTPKKLKRVAKALSEALLLSPTPSPSKHRRGKRARVEPVLAPGLAKEDTPLLFDLPPDIPPLELFKNDDRPKELLRTSATVTPRTKTAVCIEARRKKDIERYESGLLDKGFKVNFQPPNSPDLNVLDLGVWRGLQAEVDKLQRDKRNNPDVLTATCFEAWRKWGDEKQAEHINIWKRMMEQYRICCRMGGGTRIWRRRGH